MRLSRLDQVNQAWYGRPGSIVGMARQQGFTDEGERSCCERMAGEMRGRPILDLGVGAGRTVGLLRAISNDYIGLDYLPAMVSTARARFPEVDIRVGDARRLSDFTDGQFALVVFSNHGIDSMDHEGRQLALAEARRVLAPGGVFWFSTLNLQGPAARYRPWRPLAWLDTPRQAAWLDRTKGLARAAIRVPVYTRRYLRALALAQAGDGWAVAPFFAGGWHLVAHYTGLAPLLRELDAAGFAPAPEVLDDAQGRPLQPTEDLHAVFSFSVLARKR